MADYVYAIIGIATIFLCTTIGSLVVFFIRKKQISDTLNRIFIGFASGVMISASFFSLIKPALESEADYMPTWAIVAISILLGAGFLWLIDKLVPHIHAPSNEEEGIKTRGLSKTSKMFLAVTIHNVPEGLSVGIAFGVALANPGNQAMLIGALLLAIGIGIQNIPEGAVEPVAALLGLFLAMQIQVIMPWALAFAAGCMIYVVFEEMIPEMKGEGHDHYGVWASLVGFVVMLILDCLEF